jgi:Protein of unknown function (DUF1569)
MLPYAAAALALSLALVLFSMAMRHQSLLDPEVERAMVSRLDRLTPAAKGRWGRMSVAQMLRHIAGGIRMATGDLAIPRRNTPLRFFPMKQLIVFVLPFPRNAPTAPALVSKEEVAFDAERAAVRDLVSSFAKRDMPKWPDHPAFGPLNREQWGVMVWKHLDHHLRQFGV